MSSIHINVIAILYPKAGKVDRVLELLTDVAKYVEREEPGVLRYEIHRDLRASKNGTEDLVMVETYKDRDSFQVHGSSKKFQDFQKQLAQEDLMRAPMTLKLVGVKGGFLSRL